MENNDQPPGVGSPIASADIGPIAAAIFDAAVDAMVVIGACGEVRAVNSAAIQLFGWSEQALVGQDVTMLMPEPFRSEHGQYLQRYLTTDEPRIIGTGREVIAQRSDGSLFPMFLSVSEVETQGERLFAGIIHDLTERNQQRAELERSNEQLEARVLERTQELDGLLAELRRSNSDLEQFASVASHDLKTPLRNVRQALELLVDHLQSTIGAELDDEANQLRAYAVDAAAHMEELIDGLLAYSRVQGNQRTETVDLDETVAEVLGALRIDLDDVEAQVEVEPLTTVTGNRTQLRQLLHNLFSNAIRYRSPERALRVSCTGTLADGFIEIRLADNGLGIDPAQHDRIFELFRRGHSKSDGLGLGLALCRRVIEAHEGTIRVESELDAGACFVFTLPSEGSTVSAGIGHPSAGVEIE